MEGSSFDEACDRSHDLIEEHVLVAAIDFGQTYSGYGYSYIANKDDIRIFCKWGNVLGMPMAFKTPTVVMTKNEGNEFVAFGYEALHQFSCVEEDELQNYSIYERFKMYLHKIKDVGKKTYIPARKGLSASALTIFAHGLRYLADHLIETLKDQIGRETWNDRIFWVITVPAIWSDDSKQFMRQAAYQAGLIRQLDSQSLVIALEPEAASVHCRQLDVHHLLSSNPEETKIAVGTKYLVLDCGGGTLDVTVHHLRDINKVAQLYQVTGSDLGGTIVDDNFVGLLRNILGKDVVQAYQDGSPADWLNMMSQFEQKKRVVDPKNPQKTNISISFELGTIYMEVKGKRIKDAISPEWKSKGMSLSSGVLRIPHDTMIGLFAPVVDAIIDHVTDLMKIPQVKDTSHILMVGGFSESPVLQSAVRDKFGERMVVIVPPDASQCVMKGATALGHNVLQFRKSRLRQNMEEPQFGVAQLPISKVPSETSSELGDSFTDAALPHLLVAAIDFGTTYSGYAFSLTSDEEDIIMFKDWGIVADIPVTFKTPTVVLTNIENNEFVAFGYEALKAYTDSEDSDEHYAFYEKFKMKLHKEKNLGLKTYITSKRGHIASALDIFAHGLKHLSEHLMSEVENLFGSTVPRNQIRWVITVPAIWSDAAKQFMRQAALKAGIINKLDSQLLLIALEPEAASLQCRHKTQTQKIMAPGTKYLVLDCGGGTLDVTAHQLQEDNAVTELYKATGDDLGGRKIDENFTGLLEDMFGTELMREYQSRLPGDWIDLLGHFELKKKSVGRAESVKIPIPYGLSTFFEEATGEKISDCIPNNWQRKGVSFGSGQLKFPVGVIAELFDPIVNNIVAHVKTLLMEEQVKDVSHLLLVGGFGESPYLQQALKKEFSSFMKIIIPKHPSSCIMQGAVRFGHNPNVIASRRSRRTYGTDVYPIFDPSKHDPGKTKMYGGKRRAERLFRTWIKQGEEIQFGKTRTFSHVPVTAEQTNMSIGIFASDLANPQYCTDDGVEKLGNITVQLPGFGLDRKVEVIMKLGGTEITVEAKNCSGGETAKATINFMHE